MKDDKNKNFFKIIITGKKGKEDGSYNYLFGLRDEEKDIKKHSFISTCQYEKGGEYLLPKNYAELPVVELQPEKKSQDKELGKSQRIFLLIFAICAFVFTIVVLYKVFPWRRKKKCLKKSAFK